MLVERHYELIREKYPFNINKVPIFINMWNSINWIYMCDCNERWEIERNIIDVHFMSTDILGIATELEKPKNITSYLFKIVVNDIDKMIEYGYSYRILARKWDILSDCNEAREKTVKDLLTIVNDKLNNREVF